jgi:hypothetical protein
MTIRDLDQLLALAKKSPEYTGEDMEVMLDLGPRIEHIDDVFIDAPKSRRLAGDYRMILFISCAVDIPKGR